MANPATSTAIKTRSKANDVVLTPDDLAKEHIHYALEKYDCHDRLASTLTHFCDPCRGPLGEQGAYYKNMKKFIHEAWFGGRGKQSDHEYGNHLNWFEITEDKCFLSGEWSPFGKMNSSTKVAIIGNPPYSIIDDWLQASVNYNPVLISYLIGVHNLTPKRLQFMENNDYRLVGFKMTKVYKWYGMSCFAVWVKRDSASTPSVIDWDRKVWKHPPTQDEIQAKKKKELDKMKRDMKKMKMEMAKLENEIIKPGN